MKMNFSMKMSLFYEFTLLLLIYPTIISPSYIKPGIQSIETYTRTFTKYHHIRKNNHGWIEHKKSIHKRSLEIPSSNEFIDSQLIASASEEKVGKFENRNSVHGNTKNYKQKTITTTDIPKNNPGISCLYRIYSVSLSVTPSYKDDVNAQQTVENEWFDAPGVLTEKTLPSGEVVQVEQCTEQTSSCYILWHQDKDSNTTILGQGCWRSSADIRSCDKCTKVTPRLPGTKFCCCTKSYCNADFLSIKEEIPVYKEEPTECKHKDIKYSNIVAASVLALIVFLVIGVAFKRICCTQPEKNGDLIKDTEKGDVMGKGPDALATGLSCVDNLTITEHIGRGKFGTVWRGSLGSTPVAVKLYTSATAWQKEATVYALPHLAHQNILKYYGSDTRPTLTEGGREYLIVLELCRMTLRRRLQEQTLNWVQLANLAHGIASAVAHLHSITPLKPCLVHRDINSNNVLIASDGSVRLADLGLAQVRQDSSDTRVSEAGTLRYLAPESLEGALELGGVGGARASLCAVDVFAMGLVLWEILWAIHHPHCLPYDNVGLPTKHSLTIMQNMVSRNKVRPPLPTGPTDEPKAMKVMCDTCEECWDHDAEARLTAVCVEERMAELKQMLAAPAPIIYDNNLHPNQPDASRTIESDKNVNVTSDVTTPLLYHQPHIGRNPCLERNTYQTNHVQLIHKSLKDLPVTHGQTDGQRVSNSESVLSMARSTPRVSTNENTQNDTRSYQRPLEYVPNQINEERRNKETNLHIRVEKPKNGLRRLIERIQKPKETEVKLIEEKTKISIVNKDVNRPSDLMLDSDFSAESQCMSPPNRTLSPTMFLENNINIFKEIPTEKNQIFSVIVPKARPIELKRRGSSDSLNKSLLSNNTIGNSMSEDSAVKKRLSSDKTSNNSSRASINLEMQYIDKISSYSDSTDDEQLLLLSEGTLTLESLPKSEVKPKYEYVGKENQSNNMKQRSLEEIGVMFDSGECLRNVAGRVKTPGGVPENVREARKERVKSNRLSLYDDRVMFGNSL